MARSALSLKRNPYRIAGFVAILGGILYSSRWAYEISEGVLKNMYYPPSIITKNFFIIKLFFLIALLGLLPVAKRNKVACYGLLAACTGLTWTSITRTIEAYGASGPWGLFSSPGVLLVLLGLLSTGMVLLRKSRQPYLGRALVAIASSYFLGGLSAVLFFNLLGRDFTANLTASFISNLFFIAEGIGWIFLGIILFKKGKSM